MKKDFAEWKKTGVVTEILMGAMKRVTVKKHLEKEAELKSRLLSTTKKTDVDYSIVFDGVKVEEYIQSLDKRNMSISSESIMTLKTIFDLFGVPYINAPSEAETLANYLVNKGLAYAVLSYDSDCIAYQTPIIINSIDNSLTCTVIFRDKICKALELTPEQLTLFCIILGTDYNRHVKKVKGYGPVHALELIHRLSTYELIKQNEKAFQVEDDGLRYDRCVEIFSQSFPECKSLTYWSPDIDRNEIISFLEEKNVFFNHDNFELWKGTELVMVEDE